MSKDKLIPELRFPEFNNAGEWKKKFLGKIADNITTGKLDANAMSDNGKYRFYTCAKNFYRINEYAFDTEALLIAGNGAYLGYIHHYKGKFNAYQRTYVLSEFTENVIFLKYFLERFLPSRIASEKKEGNTPYIILGTITEMDVSLPKNPKEQQKIAECLSFLDEVIAAHSKKIQLLKDHKKGLMQKLFPQEGETVPKYRFPEFERDGEWKVKKLGDVAENLDSKRVPITSNQREKGDIPYYGASGIIDYVKGYIYDEKLLCISEDGANLVDRNYPIAFSISGKTWVNNHAHVLRFENFDTQTLIENYINSINIQDFLTGMAQPKLNRGKLDIIPIPLPENPKEQQIIASCLSSLDALITAQGDKIEQLRLHKKGLMQGLFPKNNE